MNQRLWISLVLIAVLFAAGACSEKTTAPVDEDDPELITTVQITLRPIDGGQPIVATWEDLDGIGGNPPNIIDTVTISPDSVYSMSIVVLNRAVTPEEDVTVEIGTEGTQHQFFFSFVGAQASIQYADKDANDLPIGLLTVLSTGQVSSGEMTIELSHYDDPSDKDGSAPSNETDISVTFPMVVR